MNNKDLCRNTSATGSPARNRRDGKTSYTAGTLYEMWTESIGKK
jgi:hypothetical protein